MTQSLPTVAHMRRWPATSVWPNEASNFNPWLAENLPFLNSRLGAPWSLSNGRAQQSAGSLFVDVLADMSDGRSAVIEAQYGTSDHSHLGKLLTYAAVYGAGAAVWIAEDPRPEHVEAVNRLNSTGFVDFYFVRLEVMSVGDDGPRAPLFTVVTGPSPVLKKAGGDQVEMRARTTAILGLWAALLPRLGKVLPGYATRQPTSRYRCMVPAGRKGIRYAVEIRQQDASCMLIIFGGSYGDPHPAFKELERLRDQVEASFGAKLSWEEGPSRCRVRYRSVVGGYSTPDRWGELGDDLVEHLRRLEQAVAPALGKLTSRPQVTGGSDGFDGLDDDSGGEDEQGESDPESSTDHGVYGTSFGRIGES